MQQVDDVTKRMGERCARMVPERMCRWDKVAQTKMNDRVQKNLSPAVYIHIYSKCLVIIVSLGIFASLLYLELIFYCKTGYDPCTRLCKKQEISLSAYALRKILIEYERLLHVHIN